MIHRALGVLRFCLGFAIIIVSAVIWIAALVPLAPSRVMRIKACNLYGKIVGRSIVFITGATPEVHDRQRIDAAMPAIYVANHTSNLDAFLSIWLCPYGGCGVVKKEVIRVPFFGWLYVLSGHLRLDRGSRERAVAALRETADFVRAKKLGIWIMPEGTRSRDGRLQPFKTGFVHLAIATGFPIVPLVIHDAHKVWPRKAWTTFHSRKVVVEVLSAIDTSAWREETSKDHAAFVHDEIASKLGADQQPLISAKRALEYQKL